MRDDEDNPIEEVLITYTFVDDTKMTGITGADGTFTTPWIRNLGRGSYFAEVTDLVLGELGEYDWNKDLDLVGSSDNDDFPDAWS